MARITAADLESLRMPPDALGNPGLMDPNALQSVAWGTDYDVQARRNAIAAALLALQARQAQQAAASQPAATTMTPGAVDYRMDQGIGPGPAPSPGQGTQSFADMLGGRPGDFMQGAPPGPSILGQRAAPSQPREVPPPDQPPPNPPVLPEPPPAVPNVPMPTPRPAPPEEPPAEVPAAPPAAPTTTPGWTAMPGAREMNPSTWGARSGNLFDPGWGALPAPAMTPGWGIPGGRQPGETEEDNVDPGAAAMAAATAQPGYGGIVTSPVPGGFPTTPTSEDDAVTGREGTAGGPGAPGRGGFVGSGAQPPGAIPGSSAPVAPGFQAPSKSQDRAPISEDESEAQAQAALADIGRNAQALADFNAAQGRAAMTADPLAGSGREGTGNVAVSGYGGRGSTIADPGQTAFGGPTPGLPGGGFAGFAGPGFGGPMTGTTDPIGGAILGDPAAQTQSTPAAPGLPEGYGGYLADPGAIGGFTVGGPGRGPSEGAMQALADIVAEAEAQGRGEVDTSSDPGNDGEE